MFRKMLRQKQEVSREECIRILKEEPRGVLSVLGDEGYPYGIPLNHWYDETDGCLYFHCGKKGHKLDAIAACDKVSFCVYDGGFRREGEWALNITSVIVFGRMRVVKEEEKMRRICTELTRKFTDDEEYLAQEMKTSFPGVLCLQLVPEHMTGKLVNEA